MMEKRDLPGIGGAFELLLDPLDLLRNRVAAFQREEPHIALRGLERVVTLRLHVEVALKALLDGIVIAERGIELHARVDQRLVRHFELVPEVLRALRPVDVVTEENRHLERKAGMQRCHLCGQLELLRFTGTGVAKRQELQRPIPIRQRHRLRRRALLSRNDGRPGGNVGRDTGATRQQKRRGDE